MNEYYPKINNHICTVCCSISNKAFLPLSTVRHYFWKDLNVRYDELNLQLLYVVRNSGWDLVQELSKYRYLYRYLCTTQNDLGTYTFEIYIPLYDTKNLSTEFDLSGVGRGRDTCEFLQHISYRCDAVRKIKIFILHFSFIQ